MFSSINMSQAHINTLLFDDANYREIAQRLCVLTFVIGVHLWLLSTNNNLQLFMGATAPSVKSESQHTSLTLSFNALKPSTNQHDRTQKPQKEQKLENVQHTTVQPRLVTAPPQEMKSVEREDTPTDSPSNQTHTLTKTNQKINEFIDDDSSINQLQTEHIIYQPKLAAPPVPPKYPETARRKRQEGIVWLDVWLDDIGNQEKLELYKGSGVASLDRAAITAIRQWQFAAQANAYALESVRVRIPVEFSLH